MALVAKCAILKERAKLLEPSVAIEVVITSEPISKKKKLIFSDSSVGPTSENALTIDDEISNFLNMSVIVNERSCPLEFYKINGRQLPMLARCAKYYFTITATSVPSEQLFSKADEVKSAKRNRLSPENAEMLVLLSSG